MNVSASGIRGGVSASVRKAKRCESAEREERQPSSGWLAAFSHTHTRTHTVSGVPRANVLRVEERGQVAIDLNEPVRRAIDALAGDREPPFAPKFVESGPEGVAN